MGSGTETTVLELYEALASITGYPTRPEFAAAVRSFEEGGAQAIVTLHPESIGYEDACGRIPVQGLLTLAKRQQLQGELIDLRNSGDTAGPRDQVVGYGAYAFF